MRNGGRYLGPFGRMFGKTTVCRPWDAGEISDEDEGESVVFGREFDTVEELKGCVAILTHGVYKHVPCFILGYALEPKSAGVSVTRTR